MRDLHSFAEVCMRQLDCIGVPYRVACFKVNNRAVKRWGQCSYRNGKFVIEISSVLLNEENSELGLKQVIVHELLHTCVGCMNHGKEWKNWADKCNKCLGYNLSRCDSAESLGVVHDNLKENKNCYHVVCKKCGHKFVYYRRCKVVNNPRMFRCGGCGGDLMIEVKI